MRFSVNSICQTVALFSVCAGGLVPLIDHAQETTQQDTHGIVVGNMDRSVRPGDNFFEYANGEWVKRTVIPPDRARIGVSTTLGELSDKRTAALIEEAAKSSRSNGSGGSKIANLYNSYMNEAAIETASLAPLRPHLDGVCGRSLSRGIAVAVSCKGA
jgi:putative endopeptidase